MVCGFCKLKYDLQCANITEKRFSTISVDQKYKWKCYGCRSKQPKTDNSNTPLRPIDSPSKSRHNNDSPPFNDNITHRKKATVDTSTIGGCSGSNMSASVITKEDVREIIREEFNVMRSALAQEFHQTLKQMVRTEFQPIKHEITAIENSVSFLNENFETTKTAIAKYQDTVAELKKENIQLTNTLQDLQIRLQIVEQHSRSNNLEIQCVPEHRQENLLSMITQLSKVISCDLKESDIHHCTRVAKSNRDDKRPRSIIVKMATPRLRDTFLARTIHFNKANPNDKLSTAHIGIGGNKSPIYIVEHLSPTNKKLHAAANQIAKDKGYKFVWIKQGRVFMRKTEEDEFIYVRNQDTLDKLKLK